MSDYDQVSFWLADAGDLTPRAGLSGPVAADVAILGAGYTGLWTALALLERDPSLEIVLCEAEVAGFGASGRNGSWCVSALGLTPGELARRVGPHSARRTLQAVRDAVDGVGMACAKAALDVGFSKDGVLRVARGSHEVPQVHRTMRELTELGLGDGLRLLSRDELVARVAVNRGETALFDPHAATLHPGRLVRGLAERVEDRGATIYERTRVSEVMPGDGGRRRPRLRTPAGQVTARTVVLAGEAYLSQLRPLRRRVLPVYSLIALTEPLDDDRWARIGWRGRECLSSQRLAVDYLARTADGRVLVGGRGAPYHFGSRIAPGYDRHAATHAMLRTLLGDWFPPLDDVEFSHAWGGPVGLPRDWLPSITYNRRTGVAAAFGYAGQGVATSYLAGGVLADVIGGDRQRWSWLPLLGHVPRRWEPEPLRWAAVRYVQGALARLDERGRRTGHPPTGRTLAERLARH